MTLHAKMAKSDSPRFLFKALSDKVCIKNRSLNGLISIVIFLAQYYWKKIWKDYRNFTLFNLELMNRALQPLHIDRVTKIMFTVLKRFILPDEFFFKYIFWWTFYQMDSNLWIRIYEAKILWPTDSNHWNIMTSLNTCQVVNNLNYASFIKKI